MSRQTILGACVLLILAAGVYFSVAASRELPPFDHPDTPYVDGCPRLERLGLEIWVDEVTNGLSDEVSFEVTVEWAASGGCEPIMGIVRREYSDPPSDPKTYSVWSRAGSLLDEPRCREGRQQLKYVLILTDAVGQRETARATGWITWPECPVVIPGRE